MKASAETPAPINTTSQKEPTAAESPVALLQSASAFSPINPSVTVSPPAAVETKPRSMITTAPVAAAVPAAVAAPVSVPATVVEEKEKEIKKNIVAAVNVNKELNEALKKIKQLEQQLIEAEKENVRSRSNNNGRRLPATVQPLDAVHQHLAALEKPRSTEGYPPQVVLAVAALVFIFTYIFF